jgi:hypothetical protein
MIGMRTSLVLATAALLCATRPLNGQAPTAAQHPTFAGTWAPSDPARSDTFFSVGLAAVPGRGRLTIEERADRLAVTITMPDENVDIFLAMNGKYYETVVYRLPGGSMRLGGFGAGGPPPRTGPTWDGDRLVLPCQQPSFRTVTMTLSLDGDRLNAETRVQIDADHANTVPEWFTRVK